MIETGRGLTPKASGRGIRGTRPAAKAWLPLAFLLFVSASGVHGWDPGAAPDREGSTPAPVPAVEAPAASVPKVDPVPEAAPCPAPAAASGQATMKGQIPEGGQAGADGQAVVADQAAEGTQAAESAQVAAGEQATPVGQAAETEPAPPALDPLVSCGILVDGLSYDLPMPWGQEEFEKARAAYLTTGGRKWLAAVMAQALPYLSYVEAKVEEYRLPKELVYLPVIESEYSPYAVSTSGATGLWQFMRNSIKGYGLSISDWVDDRKDFMKSTDAALRKLEDNEETYNDWLLALAAYNAGSGAVSRAIRAADGTSLDFWQLYDSRKLSREPLAYVPHFLAAASILRYPELHGLPAEWGEKGSWEAVETTRQVDMNILSEKAGIPLDLLKAANAELRYHITPPAASHTLKVPADKVEAVRTILADTSAPLYKYDIYKVRQGDTLGAIARRYGTPLAIVLQANPGIKADRIQIGQTLILPRIPGAAQVKPESPASDSASKAGGAGKADSAGTSSVTASGAAGEASSYAVRAGDTLWSIARKFGLRAEALARANNIDVEAVLQIGQMLKLPKS